MKRDLLFGTLVALLSVGATLLVFCMEGWI
jgi:hypothetical protein